jgi:ABC-type bacteriocin/lantibiotic exporter with double-glycine peptidase domain
VILKVKPIKQKSLHCGPCCIEMVLKFYGFKNVTQITIGKDINIKVKRGCYPRDVIRYLKRFNIIAEKRRTLNTLEYLKYKRPIIIGTQEHFMLLIGLKDKKYIIIDPSTGRKQKREYKFFKEEVKDYIIIIKECKNDKRK